MSDSHNDDPFAPPPPPPFPEHVERFGEAPVEAYGPPAVILAPPDPLAADPSAGVAAAEPRLALDGTSLWLNRLGEELVAWLKTLASAAVYATLPGNLTVQENLRVFGLIYGVRELRRRIETLLEQFDLRRFRDTRCGVLSSGEQTRVSLAKALLNQPSLLLLDEPTASLDPSTAQIVRARIRAMADHDRCGILGTSHNMYEVEAVCDRVLFLSHGRILLAGDPRTLPQQHGATNLEDLFIRIARERLSEPGVATP